jgi:hypothetical protein
MSSRLPAPRVRFDAAWFADCRNRARATLESPPARPHVVRVEPVGVLVASFVLPLELCPTLNAFAELPFYARHKIKGQALLVMRAQLRDKLLAALPGRPFVRAIRFSSAEVDRDSGWCKVAIDRLTGKHGGLGLIVDDKPRLLNLQAWWEPAPPKRGFCLVDVFTGSDFSLTNERRKPEPRAKRGRRAA